MGDFVLTLIAAPAMRPDFGDAIRAVIAALAASGARPGGPDMLAPGIACDLPFEAIPVAAAEQAARSSLGSLPIDFIAQGTIDRRKRLLIADLESTIIENEMLEELADAVGLRPQVADITSRAMNGEIDFAAAVRARVALLKGLPARALEEAAQRIRVTPGAASLVATMRANGVRTALVSGGFGVFANRIGAALGFDIVVANELEIEAERLTGRVREPILGREAKLETLLQLSREWGIPPAAALAVGDGANDVPMLEEAGLGVAYRGKPAVAARARMRVDHADLTALLYVQGYRSSDIVTERRHP
jgi:phosphoserine phosphatase